MVTADAEFWDGTIVQYGKMHESIGQQQHHARVRFEKLFERPHFYGVAALTGLKGEATIVDGKLTVTRVDAKGLLATSDGGFASESATLLVGAYVPAWTELKVAKSVDPVEFEDYIAAAAADAGVDISEPFVFTIEGEFSKLRYHVINGACPLHARLTKIDVPLEKRPFEAEREHVTGMIVGVFAPDAVGDITHPATSTHMHLVFKDDKTGELMTGHVEQLGLREGAVLRLSKAK
jgi:alpha-acetolactate decarboxylase